MLLGLQLIRSSKESTSSTATISWIVALSVVVLFSQIVSKSSRTSVPQNKQINKQMWVELGADQGMRYSNQELWLGRPQDGIRHVGQSGLGGPMARLQGQELDQSGEEPVCGMDAYRSWQPGREARSGLEAYFCNNSRGRLKFRTVVR